MIVAPSEDPGSTQGRPKAEHGEKGRINFADEQIDERGGADPKPAIHVKASTIQSGTIFDHALLLYNLLSRLKAKGTESTKSLKTHFCDENPVYG